MRWFRFAAVAFALVALLVLIAAQPVAYAQQPPSAPAPAGKLQFFKVANSDFDRYSNNPTPAQQKWMRQHYWRTLTYSPYFDSRLAWLPNSWVYKDIYAIYLEDDTVTRHPDWILRDAQGNALYIPFACSGGTCPQYAADMGNPAFRAFWIAQANDTLAQGYRGLFVDDVNLDWRVSDGNANFVQPIDPRTHQPMTRDNWQKYFAEFTEQIRSAFPDKEIVHNSLWSADPPTNPYIQREIDSADWINLERGINDDGITGGGGSFGIDSFFDFIDSVHSRGKGVLFDESVTKTREREYGVAGWLLISGGTDAYGNSPKWSTPDDWWQGYSVNLGAAKGVRYLWKNLYRRNFQGGIVLLNPPGAPAHIVKFKHAYRTLDGKLVSAVTLKPRSGIVLLNP